MTRFRLPSAAGGEGEVRIRERNARLLFLGHGRCEACRRYLEQLERERPSMRQWDAVPLAVLRGGREDAASAARAVGAAFRVLADPGSELRSRWGLANDGVALVLADRFGQVYAVERAPDADGLPAPESLGDWLRYLATQCPECGVPDRPDLGAWAP